ncbi:MAG: hypothetical protein FWD76_06290, partial [Firmicutes bacterium]|nr:hypothetical protein [Bacillota bacterium]
GRILTPRTGAYAQPPSYGYGQTQARRIITVALPTNNSRPPRPNGSNPQGDRYGKSMEYMYPPNPPRKPR